MGPLFGETYNRAQAANTKEEFFKSKEAASAAAAWGSSIAGSAVQAYGIGALINNTGVMSQKGAAYLGSLIFFASAAPSVRSMSSDLIIGSCTNASQDHFTILHREAPARHHCCRCCFQAFRVRWNHHASYMVGHIQQQPLQQLSASSMCFKPE